MTLEDKDKLRTLIINESFENGKSQVSKPGPKYSKDTMQKILDARKECGDVVNKIHLATGISYDTIKRYFKIMKI